MAKATLSISRRVASLGQTQITVEGVRHPERGVQISRRNPVTLRTAKGTTFTMADTHAVWLQHQKSPEQAASWGQLQALIEEKGPCTLDVEVLPTTLGQAVAAPVSIDDIL